MLYHTDDFDEFGIYMLCFLTYGSLSHVVMIMRGQNLCTGVSLNMNYIREFGGKSPF